MHANDVRQKGTDTQLDQETESSTILICTLHRWIHHLTTCLGWKSKLRCYNSVDGEINSPEKTLVRVFGSYTLPTPKSNKIAQK